MFETRSNFHYLNNFFQLISISKKVDIPSSVFYEEIDFDTIPKKNYLYIDPLIRNHIDSLKKTSRLYSFTINGRDIKLYIIIPLYQIKKNTCKFKITNLNHTIKNRSIQHNKKNNIESQFKKIYKRTFEILHFFIGRDVLPLNTNCSTKLSIYLYLSKLKKKLPNKKNDNIDFIEIRQININTGFSFSCLKNNEIIIFRKEEWDKVLIHEMIHALGMDFAISEKLNDIANRRMLDFFRISQQVNPDLKIYEAYTETWATILVTLFRIQRINQIPLFIQIQQAWAIKQYMKIMKYHRLKENPSIQNETELILKEKEPLYSYYILKCRLLFNIDYFFEYCFSLKEDYMKNEPIQIINFIKSSKAINSFIDLIQKTIYNRDVDITFMSVFERNFFHKKNHNKTLKMTYYS